MALRSRKQLEGEGASFVRPGTATPAQLPITTDGVTYNMAQEIAWLDAAHFAVGRWDGSLSIFRFNDSTTAGPLITTAASNPLTDGVQMIVWIAPKVFATSADDDAIALWTTLAADWSQLSPPRLLKYDVSLGIANSADTFELEGNLWLIVGHTNGAISMWTGPVDGSSLKFVRAVDLRSAHPLNPWNLYNIRGTSWLTNGDGVAYVLTGSEDGSLCIIRVPDGAVMSRTVYNPAAQRGINSIAVNGQQLLVANCSVGSGDKNLWYYGIDFNDWSIQLRDSTNLKADSQAPQVFNFCTVWALDDSGLCFFSSTEEGALWMGRTQDQKLHVIGYESVTTALGAALGWTSGQLALVNYNLYEFQTMSTKPATTAAGNPRRFSK
jgi:hypothetical protein